MTSKPKSRTIVAQNKAHTLFKLFSGRVVTIKKVVRQIGNGYKYYDLKNIEISYSIKDNKTYLYSVGDSDNLENVPVTDIKFTSSLLFRYRKRGTIIAQNPEHNLFKLYSGRVVTKQHIVKQINKGHKFYDLKNAKITYFTVGDDTFLRSTSDGTTKNNLVEVPNVILSLNKKTVHKSSAIKERLYIKSHQRKVLATILIGSILLGGTAAALCAILIKCHGSDQPQPPGPPTPPDPPVEVTYNIDGSNWQGWIAGTMIPGLINVTDHTVTYTGSYGYQAKDLVIPGTVVDADGTEYRVIAIDNIFQSSAAVTGNLTIGNNVERIGNYCFMNCNNLTGSLTLGRNITSIGSWAFQNCGFIGDLTLPNGLLKITNGAFVNCSLFDGDLTIPKSVTEIEYLAFKNLGCPNVYLDSAWTYTDFTTWYNGGTPTNNFTTGTQTWTTGHVYVDGIKMNW